MLKNTVILKNELIDTRKLWSSLSKAWHIAFRIKLRPRVKWKVWEILHKKINVDLHWKEKIRSVLHIINETILKELIHNAFNSVEERKESIYAHSSGKKITLKFYFNQEKNTLSIIVRDNWLWIRASNTHMKRKHTSWWTPWGRWVWEIQIQRTGIIDKYERVFSKDGAIIKVRINFGKINKQTLPIKKRDRFKSK